MKIKGAFNEDLAPALCYTFLNFKCLQSMSYGLSLEKKLRSYLFLDHFLRKFQIVHEISFFGHFSWNSEFCSRCRKSAPRPWHTRRQKNDLNTSRKDNITQNIFLESSDITKCVLGAYTRIYYRICEKAPLACKKYTFLQFTVNLADFFANIKALFPIHHIFNICGMKTILWINKIDQKWFPITFRAMWMKKRLQKPHPKSWIFHILKEILLFELLQYHIFI